LITPVTDAHKIRKEEEEYVIFGLVGNVTGSCWW